VGEGRCVQERRRAEAHASPRCRRAACTPVARCAGDNFRMARVGRRGARSPGTAPPASSAVRRGAPPDRRAVAAGRDAAEERRRSGGCARGVPDNHYGVTAENLTDPVALSRRGNAGRHPRRPRQRRQLVQQNRARCQARRQAQRIGGHQSAPQSAGLGRREAPPHRTREPVGVSHHRRAFRPHGLILSPRHAATHLTHRRTAARQQPPGAMRPMPDANPRKPAPPALASPPAPAFAGGPKTHCVSGAGRAIFVSLTEALDRPHHAIR
jgi:hypothetical protein